MISRRIYFAITTVMLVVFFMFQFTNVALENWDGYEENSYYQDREALPGENSAYQAGNGSRESGSGRMRSRIIYIGARDGRQGKVVHDWAEYSKRNIDSYETLELYEKAEQAEEGQQPEMLVLNSEDLDWEDQNLCKVLEGYADAGINLVFCNLPDAGVVKDNVRLQKLLGIRRVKAEEMDVEGIYLHEGFLLGGEALYRAEDQEEAKKRQDMDLTMPWYTLEPDATIYMRGITGELQKKEEDYPAVIWRNRFGRAYVFAVNGDYMEDVTGLGLLAAMSYEIQVYDIYPVVNAQNMVIVNYPGFASENKEKMEELYGQQMAGMLRDLAWPALVAVYRQNTLGLSCMIAPQYDYEDDSLPGKKELQYYMRRLKEQGAEAGLSGVSVSGTDIMKKLREDQQFLKEELPDFKFSSFYAGSLTEKEIKEALKEELLETVRTVVSDFKGDSRIIGYQSDNMIRQCILSDGTKHTYREDFRMRSVQTALGYSSVRMDMSHVAYPRNENDTLEKAVSEFGSNIGYYWKNFKEFSDTTVSECDSRIRSFLALDYTEKRDGDSIHLKLNGMDGTAWFVIRIRDGKVARVEGGNWQYLEENVWLIEAESPDVIIGLE